MLKDSVGGNCRTVMITNIWPEASHLEETISTLRFAQRMMKVSNDLAVNIQLDPTILLKKYERQIRDLKLELAMHDTLVGRGRVSYEPYNPEQQYQQQMLAEQFLKGDLEDIDVNSIRQVKELFIQFRNIYRNVERNMRGLETGQGAGKQSSKIEHEKKLSLGGENEKDLVGVEEKKFGFGMGKAPKESKPTFTMDSSMAKTKDDGQKEDKNKVDDHHVADKSLVMNENVGGDVDMGQNYDKNELFTLFKDNEGVEYVEAIKKNVQDLKENKIEYKGLDINLQKAKEKLDQLKEKYDSIQLEKNENALDIKVIEEEENSIIKEIKDAKKEHKGLLDRIKILKSTILEEEANIKQCKVNLVNKFEEFLRSRYNMTLDIDENNKLEAQNKSFSRASSQNDSEADAFLRAKEKFNMVQTAKRQERLKGIS